MTCNSDQSSGGQTQDVVIVQSYPAISDKYFGDFGGFCAHKDR